MRCYITHDMLRYITHVMLYNTDMLCYKTHAMRCYISHVMLYNTCYAMLYNIYYVL